jgi:NAD-dependent deacetylase
MEQLVPEFTLITQNIDGLHQQAGTKRVIELHGNIRRARCTCDPRVVRELALEGQAFPPYCEKCGEMLRPDVVWFGEPLPVTELQAAVEASRRCEYFFSIGTSGIVEPAASLPYEALRHGASAIEINPMPTPLTIYSRYSFAALAGLVLPVLVKTVWPEVVFE